MLKLFSHTIELSSVDLEDITGHIKRSMPDSSFNFDFIIKAFASNSSAQAKKDTTTAKPWQFALGKISLHKIYFTFNDEPAGSNMSFVIGNFKTRVKELI